MLEVIITIFAIPGLAFLLKDSDGPWDIMNWFRRTIFNNKYVGVFFVKLFDCYFCVGCHAGWIVYLLYLFHQFFILSVLAGGTICLIFDAVLSRLHRQ